MDSNLEHDQLEDSGLLFVLKEPVVKLDNGQQAKAILILDTARHETKVISASKQTSLLFRDGHPISDRQRLDPHVDVAPARTATKRPIEYVLITDKEMKAMENARNVRKRVDELLFNLMDVARASEPGVSSQSLYPSHPTHATAAPVLCVDPGPRRSPLVVPQRGINAEEDQSLVDLCLTNGREILGSADYMYCIELTLAPREENPLHSDLLGLGVSGQVYRACIDSSDTSFWLYQHGYLEFLSGLEMSSGVEKATVPPGPASALKELAQIEYRDGGRCELQRWDIAKVTTPLEVPLWKWSSNSQSKILLDFPRILAPNVNHNVVFQPYDGTFGLGVPGSRFPWNFNTGPEERTTVFDVLFNEGRPYVPSPFRMMLRLLWPIQRFGTGSPHLRSFLYFGDGIPCGVPGPTGSKLLTPEFGPQIPIEEATPNDVTNVCRRQFRCWTVRLLSMTLLAPLVYPPNYASSEKPYWEAKTISFPNMDGNGGMRAELDSASARTYVPISVYNDIRGSWLNKRNTPGVPAWKSDTFLPEAGLFQNHDIIFKFKGVDEEVFEFRCNAERFLVSPWYMPDAGFLVPFKAISPASNELGSEVVTLGMNFFWGAIVRFDAEHRGIRPVPGIDQPYVQLAAQRIVQDGKVVAEAHEIEIHQDAPPRVQAVARKQPSLLQ